MATIDGVDLLTGSIPDTSGKAWWEPYDILATNDVWKGLIMRVDEDATNATQLSTRVGFARGFFRIPKDYVTAPKIMIYWTSTKTSGVVAFDCDYRAITGDDAESYDQAGTQESVSTTDTMSGTAHRQMIATLTLTAGNLAASDLVEYELFNDGTDGSDTLAGARLIFAAFFRYDDA
jgi:hypothetical protein